MTPEKPLLLLTNDDGYASPGLRALWQALDADFETMVVAPAKGKSWVGKALSNPGALNVTQEQISGKGVAVVNDGTPADCTNLGLYHLAPRRPEMVIAGINIGANFTASLALASGTVGAALEAAVNGTLGIAVSLDLDEASEHALHGQWTAEHLRIFEPAARAVKRFIEEILPQLPLPRVRLINLVVPQHVTEPPQFFDAAPLAYEYGSVFERREDTYYNRRRGFIAATAHIVENSDVWAVQQGYVSYSCYTGNLETVTL